MIAERRRKAQLNRTRTILQLCPSPSGPLTGLLLSGLLVAPLCAQQTGWDTKSDTWVLTDSLGRTLPDYFECGPPRSGRYTAMFYLLWLGQQGTHGPYDITKILAANPDNPAWGPINKFHHWGESELGYYLSTDPYALRKHAQMLCDAGVDTLIFDVSNGFTYPSAYTALCSTFQQIRNEGGRTPQIAFMPPFVGNPSAVVQSLYDNLYAPNLYPDLWFRWEGKPLIMTSPSSIVEPMQSFFTFRKCRSGYFDGPNGPNQWGWLQVYPQHVFYSSSDPVEEMPVGVGQNATGPNLSPFNVPDTRGRSWANGHKSTDPDAVLRGLNLAEQWERALAVDPTVIFITGWNEWVAQRLTSFFGYTGDALFVDEYTQEYSRDIEPMKGGHSDLYYYQTVNYVRRYKGVRPPEKASPPTTIVIDGSFSDWGSVQPEFRDTLYDTTQRRYPGWGSAGTYVNATGRNDFTVMKVACDADKVYFLATTRQNVTSYTDANWMWLFIDVDGDRSTGWEGYDYLINNPATTSASTTLKRNTGGWNWVLVSNVSYCRSGTRIELAIPRADIGLAGTADVEFDFHWADNIQIPGDINEFAVSGDSAPNRKFNYHYNSDITPPGPAVGLTATALNDRITLRWSNPGNSDQIGSLIRYSTTGFPSGPSDGGLLADLRSAEPSPSIEHPVTLVGTYYYSVFTYDAMLNYSSAAQVSAVYILTPGTASQPQPGDGADQVSITPLLTWQPGLHSIVHNVYFGIEPDVLELRQSQGSETFSPGPLDLLRTYYWRIDEVNGTEVTTGLVWHFTTQSLNSDFDADGDVDQEDFGVSQACLSGPNIPQNDPHCLRARMDSDNDVDQNDVALFQRCMTGPGVPVNPHCAD
jgi:hypothetical protein